MHPQNATLVEAEVPPEKSSVPAIACGPRHWLPQAES
jgi:hypothetical protein